MEVLLKLDGFPGFFLKWFTNDTADMTFVCQYFLTGAQALFSTPLLEKKTARTQDAPSRYSDVFKDIFMGASFLEWFRGVA